MGVWSVRFYELFKLIILKTSSSTLSLLLFCFFCNWNLSAQGNSVYLDVKVYTNKQKTSGSDANIYFRLNTELGPGAEIKINPLINGNAFEAGKIDKFKLFHRSFSELKSLTIVAEALRLSDNWLLDKIEISVPGGKTYYFDHFNWMNPELFTKETITIYPTRVVDSDLANKKIDVECTIYTGDISKAGTNSNILLTLNTDLGTGQKQKINHLISGNAFERGDVDKFTMKHPYFNSINSINIYSNNEGVGSDWYLDKIEMKIPSGIIYTFECDCWIGGDENRKTLAVTSQTGFQMYMPPIKITKPIILNNQN